VGDNVKIASGAVVLSEIPANSTAVGVPAKVVRKDGEKVPEREHRRPKSDLDQVHIPDPVQAEISSIMKRLEAVEALLSEQETKEV